MSEEFIELVCVTKSFLSLRTLKLSSGICRDLNKPGETGPPELLSNDRPESESKSSRTCGSMPSRQPISWVSIVSRPSRPS